MCSTIGGIILCNSFVITFYVCSCTAAGSRSISPSFEKWQTVANRDCKARLSFYTFGASHLNYTWLFPLLHPTQIVTVNASMPFDVSYY